MLGPEGSKLDGTDGEVGVVPRACMQLFSGLPAGCQVAISYVEVYNDSVNDLLSSDKSKYLPLRDVGGHVDRATPQRVERLGDQDPDRREHRDAAMLELDLAIEADLAL